MLLQTHEACQCGLHKVITALTWRRRSLKLFIVSLSVWCFSDNIELV